MSLVHRLIGGTGGVFYSPYSTQPSGGNSKLVSMMRENQRDAQGEGESTPSLFSAPSPSSYDNTGFLDLSLQTQAFGPIPTGIGISEKGDVIRVNTSALEGDIDCGFYET
jgi:hypothetical protein